MVNENEKKKRTLKVNEEMYGRSPYIDYMLYLFRATSDEVYPDPIEVPNTAWNDYIDIIYSRSGFPIPSKIVTDPLPQIDIEDNKKVVLAFSGGKDSVAHAAYLKDNEKTEPILYYVKRANRSYPNEFNVSQKIAGILNVPIVVDELKYSGSISKAESPVKNHLILSLIIDYMIRNNINKCACGTYLEDTLNKTSTFFGLSDAYELYRAFEKAIKATFPNFKWLCWFKSEVHALAYLINTHKELIPEYQSCILPDRYRKNVKKANEKKFGITLMPNRCMSCWKCCQEYLILHLFRYHDLPKDLLIHKIYPQFRKDLPKVLAEEKLPKDVEHMPVLDLVDNYITLDDVKRYGDFNNVLSDIDNSIFD